MTAHQLLLAKIFKERFDVELTNDLYVTVRAGSTMNGILLRPESKKAYKAEVRGVWNNADGIIELRRKLTLLALNDLSAVNQPHVEISFEEREAAEHVIIETPFDHVKKNLHGLSEEEFDEFQKLKEMRVHRASEDWIAAIKGDKVKFSIQKLDKKKKGKTQYRAAYKYLRNGKNVHWPVTKSSRSEAKRAAAEEAAIN